MLKQVSGYARPLLHLACNLLTPDITALTMGGGSIINYQIANAYGAALSEVAGSVDCIINLQDDNNDQLQALEEKAKMAALKKGAMASSIRIIDKKILPLYYMQQPMHRIIITAAGRLS
jgi:hypothetical protein